MDKEIFINCPYDDDYFELLYPMIFTIVYLGYNPRIALENSDSSNLRLKKILQLIDETNYSIHDISRLQSNNVDEYFRLNMPFELGLDYSLKYFSDNHKTKKFLILETSNYDYRKALSDISGLDIKSHKDNPEKIVDCLVAWFVETVGLRKIGSPMKIYYEFLEFNKKLYDEKLDNYINDNVFTQAKIFATDEIDKMTIPEYIDEIKEKYCS
jgi:hypothetical protein